MIRYYYLMSLSSSDRNITKQLEKREIGDNLSKAQKDKQKTKILHIVSTNKYKKKTADKNNTQDNN